MLSGPCMRPATLTAPSSSDQAIEKIKGRPDRARWLSRCVGLSSDRSRYRCCSPRWTSPRVDRRARPAGHVGQMDSDLAALGGLFAQVVAQVQKLRHRRRSRRQRVRVADFFGGRWRLKSRSSRRLPACRTTCSSCCEGVKIVVE